MQVSFFSGHSESIYSNRQIFSASVTVTIVVALLICALDPSLIIFAPLFGIATGYVMYNERERRNEIKNLPKNYAMDLQKVFDVFQGGGTERKQQISVFNTFRKGYAKLIKKEIECLEELPTFDDFEKARLDSKKLM